MSEHESHCPFLNRADSRCANHFGLDRLDRAFDHCFGEYHKCPNYQDMLRERRNRPVHQPLSAAVYANLTVRSRPANVSVNTAQIRSSAGSVEHAAAA